MASICFYHLIIGIITDIKIILCDENVNVFPFLYAYFLDNCETPPTLLSIVQNQQKHSRHALAMCHSQRYEKNNSHLFRATAVFYLLHSFNYAIFLFTATAAAPASRIPMQKIRLIPALTSSVFGEVTAVTSSSATM